MESLGIWSLLPPVAAIFLAFATRQVLPSLFASIWLGATMICGWNPVAGFSMMAREYIVGSIADPWNATILTVCITLGGLIGIISKSGGVKAVAERLAAKSKSPRGGQFATAVLGLLIFFDDYANTLLVGNTMRPVTDRLKISREKLAYICDSTAAPVASIALVSTWATYEMGLIRDVFSTMGTDINVYEAFLKSIPYRFYSIISIFIVFTVILSGRDFGPMYKAERRARKTGKLTADGAAPLLSGDLTEMKIKDGIPLRWYNAFVPLFTVVVVMIFGLYITGYQKLAESGTAPSPSEFRDIIGNASGAVAMLWAVLIGSLVAAGMTISQKILSLRDAVDGWIEGAKSMMIAAMILILAWGIGQVCKDAGTASYLVSALENWVQPAYIPIASFGLGCVIAFATGTAYGTSAILMPVAVPLVYGLSGGEPGNLLFATIGAIFTGAVFGDHCSPISDTTIMSSMASGSDHLDHVATQAPYAITAAGIAIAAGFLPAAYNINPLISIFVGMVVVILIVRMFGKKTDN
ncbi:Na+/H+ antiporter NhaC family protein [Candidatus Latescibacterota bacterium]